MPRGQSESQDGHETGWETASSAFTPVSGQFPPPAASTEKKPRRKKDKRNKPIPCEPQINPLELYWVERAKLIKHLEKRFVKFEKKSREDYGRAKNPPREKQQNRQVVSAQQLPPRQVTQQQVDAPKAENGKATEMSGLAVGAMRSVVGRGMAINVSQTCRTDASYDLC